MQGILPGSIVLAPRDVAIHEIIGSGATSTVHRGLLKGKEVAVKELNYSWDQMSEKDRVNLVREIEILSELKHDLLVNLLGVITGSAKLQLVMDFCRGGDLFGLLHNREEIDLSVGTQIQLLKDVAVAMSILHGASPMILHRDLKSLNIMLVEPVLSNRDAVIVKLCDFGQAKKVDENPKTVCVGTQHWMAPEVLLGESYDHRADVFSFAMVMFEVICREIPFEDLTATRVALAVAGGGRPDMDAVPPDTHPELVQLMIHCWAQEAEDRPGFNEVVSELAGLRTLEKESLSTSTRWSL